MHIQEGTITTLTTCTKMTEEVDRRHGVNGNSSKGASEEPPGHNSALTATGGRLKFFKDGKFILELVRGCAREGERASWVSVPRKTFWPPAAAPPTPPAHHAPSASLSVSDDNSSVQSSPWQRDHCWKQTAPRRNVSKELAMYYCRPATLHNAAIERGARLKRRRPHDATPAPPDAAAAADPRRSLTNGLVGDHGRNGDLGSSEDAVDGPSPRPKPTSDDDREKYYHMKLKKPYQYRKLRVYKKTRSALRRRELMAIVSKLRERAPPPPAPAPAPVNAKLASCRQEHAMVSPRKRILRELERVSLEDQGGKRRAKTVPALSTASYPPPGPAPAAAPAAAPAGPSHAPPRAEPRPHNGAAPRKDASLTKNASSYSIHSLLSMSDEGASRRSPDGKHSYPPSLKTESPSSVHSPDLSPSPDNYRYRYSSLMSSPSGAAVESSTPPPELARYRGGGGGGSGGGGYVSPYSRQWASSGAQYRGAPARGGGGGGVAPGADEWREVPYLYPYAYAAPLYRAAPPLWMHYAMSPAGVGAVAVPPGPWAPLPHPLLNDHIPKDEPTSDLPLNLSKH